MSIFGFEPYSMTKDQYSSGYYTEISQMWPSSFKCFGKVVAVGDPTAPSQAELDGTGTDTSFDVAVTSTWVPTGVNNRWTLSSQVSGLGRDNYFRGSLLSPAKALALQGVKSASTALGAPAIVTSLVGIGVSAALDYTLSREGLSTLSHTDAEVLNVGGRNPEDGGIDSFIPQVTTPGDVLYNGYTKRFEYGNFTSVTLNPPQPAGSAISKFGYAYTSSGLRGVSASSRRTDATNSSSEVQAPVTYHRRVYNFANVGIGAVTEVDVNGDPINVGTIVFLQSPEMPTADTVLYVDGGDSASRFPVIGRSASRLYSFAVNGTNNGWVGT
jgi:hypothetical protein